MKRLVVIVLLSAFFRPFAAGDVFEEGRQARSEARKAREAEAKEREQKRREQEKSRQALERDARKAESDKRYDDAIALFERIITEFPPGFHLFSTQRAIAYNLARKGDYPAALQAAHVAALAANNAGEMDDMIQFSARLMSAIDNNVERANQLLAWQQSPKPGTPNPLDAVGFPAMPGREAAFARFRQEAGDNPEASRARAFTYMLMGQPHEALAQYADGFRRAYEISDWQRAAEDLARGLRACAGHSAQDEKNMQFIVFGPAGPDGKAGTADDLPNPFTASLSPPPPPLSGGLAMMAPDQVAALRKIYDAAMLFGNDPVLRTEWRRSALAALIRATSALDGWAEPSFAHWLPGPGFGGEDIGYNATAVAFARVAARGAALNFSGVRALWPRLEALCAERKVDVPKQLGENRESFERMTNDLIKNNAARPREFKPLEKPVTSF